MSATASARLTPPDMDARLEQDIYRVPEHCRQGLLDYLRYGLPPGGFLLAVLSNDLAEACSRADDMNRSALFQYVYVLYNYAPSAAWGSPERVRDWLKRGRDAREALVAKASA